jgi:hypothetical protein
MRLRPSRVNKDCSTKTVSGEEQHKLQSKRRAIHH